MNQQQTMTDTRQNDNYQSTTNYSIFKGVIGNRGIHEPHLQRLVKSIEKRNMLPSNPIIVNEKMEVVDGQHRLLAAKTLGLPIYYSIEPQANLQEIQMLNANNRGWLTVDYLESYIALGKPDYIKLKQFADDYKISVAIAIRLLSAKQGTSIKDRGGDFLEAFRDGTWHIEDFDYADRLASLITEVRKYTPDMAWCHRACIRALGILQEKVDPKELIAQLERYKQVITRRASVNDYLDQFELILNANRLGKTIRLSEEKA